MTLRDGQLARWLQAPGNRRTLKDMLMLFATIDLEGLSDGELIEYVKKELNKVEV